MRIQKRRLYFLWGFLFLLLGCVNNSFSQSEKTGKIIPFHYYIGNAIDKEEKIKLELFPEYTDSLFESAQLIEYGIDEYSIVFKTTTGSSFEKNISSEERNAIYLTIDKKMQPYIIGQQKDEAPPAKDHAKRKMSDADAEFILETTIDVLRFVCWVMDIFY